MYPFAARKRKSGRDWPELPTLENVNAAFICPNVHTNESFAPLTVYWEKLPDNRQHGFYLEQNVNRRNLTLTYGLEQQGCTFVRNSKFGFMRVIIG